MRNVPAALALVVLAVGGSAHAQPSAALTPSQVGPVRVGMTEAEVRGLGFRVDRDIVYMEADPYVRFVVHVSARQMIEIIFWQGRADQVSTTSTSYTTDRGAHVGMTLAQLRALYPDGEVNIGREEGGYFNYRVGRPASSSSINAACPIHAFNTAVRVPI